MSTTSNLNKLIKRLEQNSISQMLATEEYGSYAVRKGIESGVVFRTKASSMQYAFGKRVLRSKYILTLVRR